MDFNFLFKTQPKVVKLINNGFKKNRLAQVYLFDGAKGTPKMQAAMYLAYLLLCEEKKGDSILKPCDECLNCHRLYEGVHPRLFMLAPSKAEGVLSLATIKKEQIDQLEKEFSYSGLEKGARVFIISDIDQATLSAANSLLKFLEEMKEDCYGILLTENNSKVLTTIKSRSQIITFDKIDNETLKDIYLSKGIDEELAKVICTITNNTTDGFELAKSDNFKNIITLVKKITQSFFNDTNPIMIMNEDGRFLLSSSNKEDHQMFLDLLITMTNDRMYFMLGKKDEMVFSKTIEEMDEYGFDIRQIDYQKTFKQVETMLEFKERINYNVNLELMYMDLFIRCEVK